MTLFLRGYAKKHKLSMVFQIKAPLSPVSFAKFLVTLYRKSLDAFRYFPKALFSKYSTIPAQR